MRDQIIKRIVQAFEQKEYARGCFLGGSASFSRNDEWSDIDLQIIVQDESVDEAVAHLEQTVSSIGEIETRFILPAPTWHGHWQGFYQLKGISPFLMLDLVIMKESSPSYLTEVELHGTPVVYFDKTGKVGNEHIDLQELDTAIRRRLARIASMSPLNRYFVLKEIRRGRETDAFEMYYNLFYRTLIELLRIKYDPARWSWGPKYLVHILPADVYARVKTFPYARDMKELEDKLNVMQEMIDELLQVNLEAYPFPEANT